MDFLKLGQPCKIAKAMPLQWGLAHKIQVLIYNA